MKDELKRLKAGLLALIMCFSLSSCASSEEEIKDDKDTMVETTDTKNYLIAFIEGKAVIYEENSFTYSNTDGYAAIYEDVLSIRFLQTPCVVLTGKENCINFASSIVGKENIIFMDFSESRNQELILTPNN